MITPLEFARKYEGQTINSAGGIGGECVDLADQWIAERWGLAHVFRNAVDWAKTPPPGMGWTANTPANYPKAGALVVWGPYQAEGIGPFGHIALVLAAESMELLTLDQNWSGRFAHMVLHGYGGVLGWLYRNG